MTAGCGGAGGTTAEQVVRGRGYSFSAPVDWNVSRTARELRAAEGSQLVSVTRFALLRGFRPGLWEHVLPELDRAAAGVARQQDGRVAATADIMVAGRRARRYDIEYERDGKELVERIAFVLRGKTEYLLLCRYERGGDTRACDRLLDTFTLG
jgi:hypothetical protein